MEGITWYWLISENFQQKFFTCHVFQRAERQTGKQPTMALCSCKRNYMANKRFQLSKDRSTPSTWHLFNWCCFFILLFFFAVLYVREINARHSQNTDWGKTAVCNNKSISTHSLAQPCFTAAFACILPSPQPDPRTSASVARIRYRYRNSAKHKIKL